MSYSSFSLIPLLGKSYSKPPKMAVFPENQFLKENVPPSPKSVFLSLKPSCNEDKGLDMLLAVPNIPQPIPNVKSRCPSFFEATIYSEENKPVPAISLSPKATAGKIYVSFFIRAFKSKPLSFKD